MLSCSRVYKILAPSATWSRVSTLCELPGQILPSSNSLRLSAELETGDLGSELDSGALKENLQSRFPSRPLFRLVFGDSQLVTKAPAPESSVIALPGSVYVQIESSSSLIIILDLIENRR